MSGTTATDMAAPGTRSRSGSFDLHRTSVECSRNGKRARTEQLDGDVARSESPPCSSFCLTELISEGMVADVFGPTALRFDVGHAWRFSRPGWGRRNLLQIPMTSDAGMPHRHILHAVSRVGPDHIRSQVLG